MRSRSRGSLRAFAIVVAAVLMTACDSASTELRFVAPSSPLDLEIAENLKLLLDQDSGFRLDITDQQHAGEAALDMLLAGKADIALVSNYLPYRDGISTVMPLYPSVLHIAYRDGRDPSNGYSLLNNANIYAGAEGSASRLMFERLSLFSFGSPSEIGAGSVVDAASLLNPPLRPFVIPASTYGPATSDPVVTVAVDKILVVRNNLSASVVYDLINTIRRLRPALSATRPGLFSEISEDFDVSRSTFVLHAGTQDFLQRSEPTVYERYSGVAEVLVTLVIALASATLAGFRILKMRRKNRIDKFYSAAIEIRNSISGSSTADERSLAAKKIRELQDTAFDQLVAEKLSADESFRIFVTLSNDVLDQLKN